MREDKRLGAAVAAAAAIGGVALGVAFRIASGYLLKLSPAS